MSNDKVRLRVEVEVHTNGLHCARKCQFLRVGLVKSSYLRPSCTLFEQVLLEDTAATRPNLPVRLQQCLKAEHWAMGVKPKETGA